jgi:hypothetical protein
MSAFVATRQKLNGVTLVKAEKVLAHFDVAIVFFGHALAGANDPDEA